MILLKDDEVIDFLTSPPTDFSASFFDRLIDRLIDLFIYLLTESAAEDKSCGDSNNTAAVSSRRPTSTRGDGRAEVSTDGGLSQVSRGDDHLTPVNGLSDHFHATTSPPPPLTASPSSTAAAKLSTAARRQKPSPAARSRATSQSQPAVSSHEALLAAIRDAAGGRGLRKVATNVLLPHI